MRFIVSNLVVSHIDIIFIACAVDFQCLKESFKVGIIMFVLGTDYLLDVEDSGSQIAKDQYQFMQYVKKTYRI